MGITVIGREKEEITHLTAYARDNIRDIKSFLIIYLVPSERDEEKAKSEVEEEVKKISGDTPYEIKTFTGSPDMAIETFLARREDIRMVFLHVRRRDIREILEDDEYTVILRKLQKGVVKTPVVFVPHR
ncbi:hypothetical protein BCF55_1153 [Hydrogenivirga caldilitoris]|uniref:Universal stress protein family protein n=1 Tax=Hydrogenivirga caldilitoris TaxID=246264 RepID=A0A497XPH6_9AQUI|nr:hypothetical protein [Hydrogenivirga caldilitoris]RLJ70867.1 hypothetical protein BCF55_1153 [Hydrogenivirga caldilitoris]